MRAFALRLLCVVLIGAGYGLAEDPPPAIYGTYRKPGDTLKIFRKDGKTVISVHLSYANGHSCNLDGTGEWKDSKLLITAEGTSREECRLELSFEGGAVVFKDPDFGCTRYYCGTRGTLEPVRLPKAAAPAKK